MKLKARQILKQSLPYFFLANICCQIYPWTRRQNSCLNSYLQSLASFGANKEYIVRIALTNVQEQPSHHALPLREILLK